MRDFEIIIPYYNGEKTILKLIETIPGDIQIILVDDQSTNALPNLAEYKNVRVIKDKKKGYFTGAVNFGLESTSGDVLILNQDVYFTNTKWIDQLEKALKEGYSYIGERIRGTREDWPNSYIHGTYMYLTRELIDRVGLMNAELYPMWGSTAEYQLRAARANFKILPLQTVEGFIHRRPAKESFGNSFKELLQNEPDKKREFVLTPPLVSVIIPVYGEKYAQFLPSTINSLIGGKTDLGEWKQQTFASFEVVIVEDSSTDNTPQIIDGLCDGWKAVRAIHLKRPQKEVIQNGRYAGKVFALNAGIKAAYGKYITILDCDDMMAEDRLQRLYETSVANPHSLVYDAIKPFITAYDGSLDVFMSSLIEHNPNVSVEDLRLGEPVILTGKPAEYDFDNLIYKNTIHNAIMFEKSAWKEVGGYPERFMFGREDWAMNVRLGSYGYCGVQVPNDYAGLYYRRDGQNRTNENAKSDWMKYFQSQMVKEFRNLYKGERPMSCCSGNKKVSQTDNLEQINLSKYYY